MQTPREKARLAARMVTERTLIHGGITGPEQCADVVSDLYDPIVAEREKMIRHLIAAGDALVRGRRRQGWGRRQKDLTDEEIHWVKSVAEIEEELSETE